MIRCLFSGMSVIRSGVCLTVFIFRLNLNGSMLDLKVQQAVLDFFFDLFTLLDGLIVFDHYMKGHDVVFSIHCPEM